MQNRPAVITSILQAFGPDNNIALAAKVIWRAATFLPQPIVGGLTMLFAGRKSPEAEEAPT